MGEHRISGLFPSWQLFTLELDCTTADASRDIRDSERGRVQAHENPIRLLSPSRIQQMANAK